MISYQTLPAKLYAKVSPEPVSAPAMVIFNHALVQELELQKRPIEEWVGILSGNQPYPGQTPFSMAYAGHQYGRFTMLGDGRAHVIAEITKDQQLFDLQLKGSGSTPFSRGGDGRAVLGPMLREYLISEAMHALAVPTTRSLGVVSTGENVYRDTPLPGGVLGRVADSHIRVGTFQYAAVSGEEGLLKQLADYSIQRHYPALEDEDDKYRRFLQAVIERQAKLIAKWMSIGFVHGVMNTDNMAISGQTIDYGPCAFIDTYKPDAVFSSIDRNGRYAYNQQPNIALWNLTRFAETLLSLLDANSDMAIKKAEEDLASFSTIYINEYYYLMGQKLGFYNLDAQHRVVVDRLLDLMHQEQWDYTTTFTSLTNSKDPSSSTDYLEWMELYRHLISKEPKNSNELMKQVNPVVIPRNQIVQEALDCAEGGDMDLFMSILHDLQHPFETPREIRLLERSESNEPFITYCGT
jgi:serine/tyrosine/threonine adenylyltransferase